LSYLGGASPIRNSINRQSIKTLASLIGVVVVFFAYSGVAHADRFDAQIAALRTQAQQQQAVANQFTAQATDYQTRVNQLNAQMGALQAQISLSQAQSSRLTQQIADNESKLAQEKSVLGSNLKVMYLDSSISPLEMLASSNNLSDYFNQQQYQDSIKDKIQASMSTILQTQKDLARQQTDVTNLLVSQRTQNAQLAASRDEVNNLLAIASSNVAAANATVKNSNARFLVPQVAVVVPVIMDKVMVVTQQPGVQRPKTKLAMVATGAITASVYLGLDGAGTSSMLRAPLVAPYRHGVTPTNGVMARAMPALPSTITHRSAPLPRPVLELTGMSLL
jgi:peptidoglycan hydrolase CwlO-like protein